ncbi:MAG: ribosomal protection-like ABC-F family protein [Anaerolineae bacterium]
MSLVVGQNLSKVYGGDEIFSGINVEIPHKARIALVGPNGAGKTTLISLLIGLETPTEGTVTIAKSARIAHLPQRPEMAGSHTLWEEQLRAVADLRQMEAELAALAAQMADPATHAAAAERYSQLEPEFERRGGYTYETRIRMVLDGVGFRPEDYHTPLTQLSGGQKTRAMLARLLIEAPDLLVLDEPTNHLDIAAVEWLENFLSSFEGAVLVISHDRYFIDHVATTIWELEFGTLETYRGNYSAYLTQRDERRERLQKEFEAQQAFIAKEMDYIRKHMGSRWTAQAKGRLKKLETMKKRGKIIERGPQDRRKMRLQMAAANRSGDKVIETFGLAVGYPDDPLPLFRVPDVTVFRGETVAVIGPNGAGKSTLLKTILGQLPALSGHVKLGASVKVGYFAQAHETLDPRSTLIDAITSVRPMPQSEARSILGAYLFSGDDAFRTVDTLSGGERGRVALARLALMEANLLLLDEPTNHLDIDSQEILQAVIEDFDGTVLLISHDRYLIARLATQIWAVSTIPTVDAQATLEIFDGTYDEFISARSQRTLNKLAEATPSRRPAAPPPEKKNGLNPYQRKRRLEELEARISALEDEQKQLQQALEQASAAGDALRAHDLGQRFVEVEQTLEEAVEEWSLLAE